MLKKSIKNKIPNPAISVRIAVKGKVEIGFIILSFYFNFRLI
jgi:hypothetical protein